MPYTHKKVGNKQCVYKKDTGEKVGCTSGPVSKYLAALHIHSKDESIKLQDIVKKIMERIKNNPPKS
jgi:hypothetical protein